jgi:hypothetical protein
MNEKLFARINLRFAIIPAWRDLNFCVLNSDPAAAR